MPASEPVNLKEKVRHLPDKPGVYLMKDRLGRIIYVGKAKSLKKRVSSYFQRGRARTVSQPKIRALIEMIADLETIEVKSEPEALLLPVKILFDLIKAREFALQVFRRRVLLRNLVLGLSQPNISLPNRHLPKFLILLV